MQRMSKTKYYNIHNLMKVSSNKKLKRWFFFETSKIDEGELDLVIQFGKFKPNLRGATKVEKYSIMQDAIYCEDHHKLSYWKILIKGLHSDKTTIFFDGDPLFSDEIFLVLILEPLLTYKFARKAILLLHSSSLSLSGKGILFCGETGTGKTLSLLTLLDNPNTEFFADDQTIVKDAILYSYPLPIGFRTWLVRKSNVKLGLYDILVLITHNLINIATRYYGNLTHRIRARDIEFRNTGIKVKKGVTAPIGTVFILTNGNSSSVKKISSNEAYGLLQEINMQNKDKQAIINRYFLAYKEVYPFFGWRVDFESLLSRFVENATFYQITIDDKLDRKQDLGLALKICQEQDNGHNNPS